MNTNILPVGNAPAALSFCHFPTRWQPVIWRNFLTVPPERLAQVLHTVPDVIRSEARRMGLEDSASADSRWLEKGYITVIKDNWHLLNYPQLLTLLGWTPEHLMRVLKEEDFLFVKLGSLKPGAEEVRYSPLSPQELAATEKLKKAWQEVIPPQERDYLRKPFDFRLTAGSQPAAGKDEFSNFNFIHAYSATCGDLLLDIEHRDPLPESLLQAYQACGVKGIWIHAVYSLLHPVPGAESFSGDYPKRLRNLQILSGRCQRYGMSLYLYCNEPRGMTEDFYRLKPQWRGVFVDYQNAYTNCLHCPEVLEYTENATFAIFSQVKNLGGAFYITMSENPTHCHSNFAGENCPYCKNVPPEEQIAAVANAVVRGMKRANPEAKAIFYDWAWRATANSRDNADFKRRVIDRLPEGCCLLSVSEWNKKLNIGGIPGEVIDYSISQTGPSEESRQVWKHAQARGIRCIAKVQLNNSWELAAVPYLPVAPLLEEHLNRLRSCGICGLMLSWTLGGFPGGNLGICNRAAEELLASQFGSKASQVLWQAEKIFGEAFRNFPFHVTVLYRAPMNVAPVNLLSEEPAGYTASMVGFPYDDLKNWRAIYPEEVFERQFALLWDGWREGLKILTSAEPLIPPEARERYEELCTVSRAAGYHWEATLSQIRFVRARESRRREDMLHEAQIQLDIARKLWQLSRKEPLLGFEASNHYFYHRQTLWEKIINCRYILAGTSRTPDPCV